MNVIYLKGKDILNNQDASLELRGEAKVRSSHPIMAEALSLKKYANVDYQGSGVGLAGVKKVLEIMMATFGPKPHLARVLRSKYSCLLNNSYHHIVRSTSEVL